MLDLCKKQQQKRVKKNLTLLGQVKSVVQYSYLFTPGPDFSAFLLVSALFSVYEGLAIKR